MIVVSRLISYHEFFRSSDKRSAHNTLKLIVNPEEYECHLNKMLLVATNNVTDYVNVCRQKTAQLVLVRGVRKTFVFLFQDLVCYSVNEDPCCVGFQLDSFYLLQFSVIFDIHRS